MTQFAQFLIIGISKGAIYGLIALGFVLVFKATRVFNYAQGHLMMVGSFMLIAFGPILGLNVWLSMLVAVLSAVFIGLSFERVFVRPLLGLGFLAIVMATIGAALIIQCGGADQLRHLRPRPTRRRSPRASTRRGASTSRSSTCSRSASPRRRS